MQSARKTRPSPLIPARPEWHVFTSSGSSSTSPESPARPSASPELVATSVLERAASDAVSSLSPSPFLTKRAAQCAVASDAVSSQSPSPFLTKRAGKLRESLGKLRESQSFVQKSTSSPMAPVPTRCVSQPVTPVPPPWSPATLNQRRRRIKSADHAQLEWRFGASVAIIKSPVTDRHSLEVTTSWGKEQKKFSIEIRRLLFWFVVAVALVLPANGLKISPQAHAIVRSGNADLVRSVRVASASLTSAYRPELSVASGAEHGGGAGHTSPLPLSTTLVKPPAVEADPHQAVVVDPLLAEISSMIVKEGSRFGMGSHIDDNTLQSLLGQVTQLFREGEISLHAVGQTTLRACASVVMHKAISAALDSEFVNGFVNNFATCVLHMSQLH